MLKFGINDKTITPNEKTVLWKHFNELFESAANKLMVSELNYGQEKGWSRERTQQTTGKLDNEPEVLRETTTIDDKLKRPVERLASIIYESVSREKTAPTWLASVISRKSIVNMLAEKQDWNT